MLLLASLTLLGALVSAEPTSNVVTPEGSGLPDPSVGHELFAVCAEKLVHDSQPHVPVESLFSTSSSLLRWYDELN